MNLCWNRRLVTVALVAACAAFALCKAGHADVVVADPSLPVTYPDGEYLTPQDVHARYSGPGLLVVLKDIRHRAFAVPPILRQEIGSDEYESFSSGALGNVSVNGGPQMPIHLQGPVSTVVRGKVGHTTGVFETEMLSMQLTGWVGPQPVMIRESPTLPTLGRTSISDIGGGLYHIDSFFDVFTELSLDGGQMWIPSESSVRVNLEPAVPEPGILPLLGLALMVLSRNRRR